MPQNLQSPCFIGMRSQRPGGSKSFPEDTTWVCRFEPDWHSFAGRKHCIDAKTAATHMAFVLLRLRGGLPNNQIGAVPVGY